MVVSTFDNPVFGVCDCDYVKCYASGCICRLNPSAGFQLENGKPFRNRSCSHFHEQNEGVLI